MHGDSQIVSFQHEKPHVEAIFSVWYFVDS